MVPLTTEGKKSYHEQKFCHICKKEFSTDDKKVRDYCHFTGKYRGPAHDVCNLNCKATKEILVVFHNDFTYDYHFVIKELAAEFEGQFKCLAENTKKCITFSVSIKNDKKITYKIKFIDNFRILLISLSSLAGNLSDRLHSDRCTDCKPYPDYMSVKDDQLIFRCFECKKKTIKNTTIKI